MKYTILSSKKNTNRKNNSNVPYGWNKSKQAYWSDIGKKNKNTSYSKNRDSRRSDNPRIDGISRKKKYRWKMKVKSKNGNEYTRYIYRKPVKTSTKRRYNN